jgi:hypothetical protein
LEEMRSDKAAAAPLYVATTADRSKAQPVSVVDLCGQSSSSSEVIDSSRVGTTGFREKNLAQLAKSFKTKDSVSFIALSIPENLVPARRCCSFQSFSKESER